jgi:hypothetical protein
VALYRTQPPANPADVNADGNMDVVASDYVDEAGSQTCWGLALADPARPGWAPPTPTPTSTRTDGRISS